MLQVLPQNFIILSWKLNSSLFFSDNVNGAGRTLTVGVAITGGLTMEKCTAACYNAGLPLAGSEYAGFVFVNHRVL